MNILSISSCGCIPVWEVIGMGWGSRSGVFRITDYVRRHFIHQVLDDVAPRHTNQDKWPGILGIVLAELYRFVFGIKASWIIERVFIIRRENYGAARILVSLGFRMEKNWGSGLGVDVDVCSARQSKLWERN